jgi:hypothetical protein
MSRSLISPVLASQVSGVELPRWLAGWCAETLGSEPRELIFFRQQASSVYGAVLKDGRSVVLKSRRDEFGRAAACVAAQRALAEDGFPCALPLTEVDFIDGRAVHAETYRPGGGIVTDNNPDAATQFGSAYACTLAALAAHPLAAPGTNPDWVRWSEPTAFPRLWWQDESVLTAELPSVLMQTVERVRHRLQNILSPPVLGHADWETQNLRWEGETLRAVHDWDSLAILPECTLVGVSSGTFANFRSPTLPPIDSSAAFLAAYQCERNRRFDRDELECAWAASLWSACYNARIQVLYQRPTGALDVLMAQASDRLALAGC